MTALTQKFTNQAANIVRVMIVDDHPTVCEGLTHRISSQADMSVCGEAMDVDEALRKIRELEPDIVIVDIGLKNSDGLDLVKQLKSRHQHIRSIVHSMYDETIYADRCLRAGAMGYINKESNPNDVIHAIREVSAGRVYLSPAMASHLLSRTYNQDEAHCDPIETLTNRQLEVFRLISQGKTTTDIAKRLHISIHTVETHRDNIKHKLSVSTANELTRHAILWAEQNR